MAEKFIQTQVLYSFLDIEAYILLGFFVIVTWLFYKFFLQSVSPERHKNIHSHFRRILHHFAVTTALFLVFFIFLESEKEVVNLNRVTPYIASLCFLWGAIVFVKTARLLVLQYLFMGSMREGVPLLLVNVFSLLLSVIILFWSVSRIFAVQLGPLVATSAAFSIILGLALQDTLGNLFAGISLQLDKSFEIGDWVEVTSGTQKSVGQVKEISWRSTVLVGFSDELITLPNRYMAQAQIANFSPPDQPILRSQTFRLPFHCNIDLVKKVLEQIAVEISEIKALPAPLAYVQETTDSWISVKLIYFIDSYGAQFLVGDKIHRKGIDALAQHGISLAQQSYKIETT